MKEDQKSASTGKAKAQENKSQENQGKEKQMKRSGWKRFLAKKWTFPAIYMGAAALILAIIMWYQNPNDYSINKEDLGLDVEYNDEAAENQDATAELNGEDPEAVTVATEKETFAWPVSNDDEVDIVTNFYEESASEEVKAAAMIKYKNQFWPHTGIDLTELNGESFDVLAALSGTVTKVEKDPMVGNLIEIEHPNNLVTVYQSLGDVEVQQGDEVKQGDVIGTAGRNLFEKGTGVHLHFEVRENGEVVSPDTYLSQAKNE